MSNEHFLLAWFYLNGVIITDMLLDQLTSGNDCPRWASVLIPLLWIILIPLAIIAWSAKRYRNSRRDTDIH